MGDPRPDGVIPLWQTLSQTDLGEGVQGSSGDRGGLARVPVRRPDPGGLTGGAARTNLAPQPPFFQLGLLGATVPGLKLDGEIGQQIGYLNAATVGAVNFILLIIVGWGFAHKERVRELVAGLPAPPRGRSARARPSRAARPRRARPGPAGRAGPSAPTP